MRTRIFTLKLGAAALTYAALALTANPALAIKYWLRADAAAISMPNSTGMGTISVPMWGYALCGTTGDGGTSAPGPCGAVTFPGPALTVPAGEQLIVNLDNALPVPTSLVINGLIKPMAPVWDSGAKGARPSPTARVRSFDIEAEPNGGLPAVYTWSNVPPGTYLYQSGTNPQVQVQMGLYGAVTRNEVDATTTARAQAYKDPSTPPPTTVAYEYDNQALLLYSEIDPALHEAVAAVNGASYGPAGTMTSTVDYAPKYFLINGRPAAAGAPIVLPSAPAGTTLLRMLNAGLTTHVPMILGTHWDVIAEDGKPYAYSTLIGSVRTPAPYKRSQYTVLLPAAKTTDVLLTTTTAVSYAIMDRRLSLSNNGVSGGGMMAFVGSGAVAGGGTGNSGSPTNEPPVAVADPSPENAYLYQTAKGVTLSVAAPGVLANDTDANVGQTIRAVANSGSTACTGTYTLNAKGSFTYVPPAALPADPLPAGCSASSDTFTYIATDGQPQPPSNSSAPALVTISVVEPLAPSLTALDDFTRDPATATSLGTNWAQQVATVTSVPDIGVSAGGQAVANSTGLGGLAIWNAESFGPTQGAGFVSSGPSYLVLKATGPDPKAPVNYIRVGCEASKVVVYTMLGGSNTSAYVKQATLGACSPGGLSAAVDGKGLVTTFVGGAFAGGVQLPDVAAWKGGGRIGIQLTTLGVTADDFGGCTLDATNACVAP